jgi:hypothetical protein
MKLKRALLGSIYVAAAIALAYLSPIFANPVAEFTEDGETQTLIINDAPEMKVIAISKNVIVRNRAKEVLVWGGNVTIEGSVDGDVATIGGSVIQKESGYIGGDVIVFGGSYNAESSKPLRAEGKDTVMFGMFEEELRGFAKDPSQILRPEFNTSFLVQRLLAVIFWFLITMGAATIAPGAVGRSIAGMKLSALKLTAAGAIGFVFFCFAVIAGIAFLPEYVSAAVGLMGFVLLMLAYGFGRVIVHVAVGKLVIEHLFQERRISESIAVLTGVVISVTVLSIPYVWPIAVFGFFAIGIGLVLSARTSRSWKAS